MKRLLLFLLLFSAISQAEIDPNLRPVFAVELAKDLSQIEPCLILKKDRFAVWWRDIGGTRYVFKRRVLGKSWQEKYLRVKLGDRQNISRFEESERVQSFVDRENLKHIRIPGIMKVRFQDDGESESDFNTGIVQEYVDFPTLLSELKFPEFWKAFNLHSDVWKVPEEAFHEVGRLAVEAGVEDLSLWNLKYNAETQELWLPDLEVIKSADYEKLEKSKLPGPINRFRRWQLDQRRKVWGGIAPSVMLLPIRPKIAMKIAFQVLKEGMIKELPAGALTAAILPAAWGVFRAREDRTYQQMVEMSEEIESELRAAPEAARPATIRRVIKKMRPWEKRKSFFLLFEKRHEILFSLQKAILSKGTLDFEDAEVKKWSAELVENEHLLRKIW